MSASTVTLNSTGVYEQNKILYEDIQSFANKVNLNQQGNTYSAKRLLLVQNINMFFNALYVAMMIILLISILYSPASWALKAALFLIAMILPFCYPIAAMAAAKMWNWGRILFPV